MATIPIWPGSLPTLVLQDNYAEAPRMTNVEFASDTGPPIERPKGTVRLTDLTLSTIMTDDQVRTFDSFVFNDLAQATSSFFWLHPRRQEQVKVRFKGRPPYTITNLTPSYTVSPGNVVQGNWKIDFTLTVIG
jgi:hypothetical protein